jgi:type II secretory pathway pseudopilin PulG
MKQRFDNRKGFTLVEILVVLALTMMIMMLVFPPLVNSLKITRQAEIIVRAQDSARFALAQISSDLADAMYVYDNTLDPVNFPIPDAGGAPVVLRVIYAKVDLVLPKMRGFCPEVASHTPGGDWRGDEAAPMCPVCGVTLEMRPIQPLVQSDKIVRYFIGLKDPTRPYSNGFRQRLAEAGTDNMYILYRAEFHPLDPALFPKNSDGTPRTEDENRQDPNFFYNPGYEQAWRDISRPVGAIEDVDLATIEYDAGGSPTSVTPTVKFTPTAIYNDPLTPTASSENNPDQGDAPPTVYKATYGHWVLPYKVVLEPAGGGGGVTYETWPGLGLAMYDVPTDMCIYRVSGSMYTPVFNITHYEKTKANSIYGVGDILPLALNQRELAFTVDTVKGSVNFAFPNVYANYCATLNTSVRATFPNIDAQMPLSDVANTDDINNDPAGRLLINCAPSSGPDPRIFDNATIVPGSVKITAPDAARAAATPPQLTYTRTPFPIRDPQPNQFSADLAHNLNAATPPTLALGVGAVYFCRSKPVNPNAAAPLPSGVNNVWVYYEVQNNRKGDVLRASYVTKSVMTIMLGIRIYDSTSGKAQMAQFTNKVRLRNVAS